MKGISRAFTFMFGEEKWALKLGLLSLICLIVTFIPIFGYFVWGALITIVGTYMMKRMREGYDEEVLPSFGTFGDEFESGVVKYLISLIYSLPIGAALVFSYGAIFILIMSTGETDIAESVKEAMGWIGGITLTCLSLFVVMFWILAQYLVPAAWNSYDQERKFGAAFNFARIWDFIRIHFKDLSIICIINLIVWAVVIGVYAFLGFGVMLFVFLSCCCLLYCIAPIFLAVGNVYASLVNFYLYGLLFRETAGSSVVRDEEKMI